MKKQSNPTEPSLFYGAPTRTFEYARQNRAKPTPAEEAFWEEVRGNKLLGLKFRRQHPVGRFILDFYCHQAKLAIELDGAHHFEESQLEYDRNRSALLEEAGILEIRFTNEEVLNKRDKVIDAVLKILEGRAR